MGSFLKAKITDETFIKGPARVIYAADTVAFPTKISDMVRLTGSETDEVQNLVVTGVPTGGTFTLSFDGSISNTIAHNAAAAAIQAELEAMDSIGPGNVTCTGGPLPTAVVIAFGGQLGKTNVPTIIASSAGLTGGSTPTAAVTVTTPGAGQYDVVAPWLDLGATMGGVSITRNNTEEVYEVDQIPGDVRRSPTGWTMSVATSIAEITPAMIQLAWQTGAPTWDATADGGTMRIPIGAPTKYTRRRLAVLFKKDNDKVRGHTFRIVQRSAADSALAYQKAGAQQSLPITFAALADSRINDADARFGDILDME